MSIDERLENTSFPLPAIREVNLSKHPSGISLGLGELKDFDVDEKIFMSLKEGWQQGGTSYTQNAGLPDLRKAIAQKHSAIDGFPYTMDNIIVTIGVQNAVYTSLLTLAKLGAKRVLIPEIHFGIYKKIPLDFGMEVVSYPLKDDFGIDEKALNGIIKEDDVLIINSPSNPTGRVLSLEEQKSLGELLAKKLTQGYVISDEIYGQLVYDAPKAISFSAFFDRTIVVDGISKSAAAAGLRVGWIITNNEKLAKAFTSNNATIISTPPTANQYAALPVVKGETEDTISTYRQILKANRDKVIAVLDKLNIPYVMPKGSFYIFPKVSTIVEGDIKEFCLNTARKENGVVVIPGVAFGAPDYIRISLASKQIDEGMRRFEEAIRNCLK